MGHDEVQVASCLTERDQASGSEQLVVQSGIGRPDLENKVRVDSDRYAPGLASGLELFAQALTVAARIAERKAPRSCLNTPGVQGTPSWKFEVCRYVTPKAWRSHA